MRMYTEDMEKLYVLDAEMRKKMIDQWLDISVPLELTVSEVKFIIFSLKDLSNNTIFLRDSCVQFLHRYVVHK